MTYSFLDVQCGLVGPGGSINLGAGAAVSAEGITFETNERDALTIGADGTPVHTLIADRSGKVQVRLMKTSNQNALLQSMFEFQSISSITWGQNVITLINLSSGDTITARSVAFEKSPSKTYAKDSGMIEWSFNAGYIDTVLGTYLP